MEGGSLVAVCIATVSGVGGQGGVWSALGLEAVAVSGRTLPTQDDVEAVSCMLCKASEVPSIVGAFAPLEADVALVLAIGAWS